MNRREALRITGIGVGFAVAAPVALMQIGCASTKQLVKWATVGIQALTDLSPILTEMGAGQIVDLIAKALPIAEKLRKAFQDNDNVSASQFITNLVEPQTGLIAQIAAAVGLLTDDPRRKFVFGLLASAQVMFRLINAQIVDDTPVVTASAVAKASPRRAAAIKAAASPDKLRLAFEASRF